MVRGFVVAFRLNQNFYEKLERIARKEETTTHIMARRLILRILNREEILDALVATSIHSTDI